MGSLGFRWPGSRGKLHQRSSCTSHCRCKESQSRCSRHISCLRKCRCCRLRANSYCSGTGNRIVRVRSVARQRSRVFLGPQQSWCSPNPFAPASSSRGLSTLFQGSHGQQRARGIPYLFRSDWSLRWLDVCFCTDASEKGFAFAVRQGCRELASAVGLVSERTRFKRSSRSIRARSRALRSIAPDVGSDCSSSDENEVPLA